jgi:hypothetical protein
MTRRALSALSTDTWGMSLDLSTLAVLCSPRKPRRPVAEEMLSIRVRDVRPLVEVGQETDQLPAIGRPLTLLWRWRSSGWLGPQAAAAMNSRHRIPRSSRLTEEPPLDRGARGGWHLYLICQLCSRAFPRLLLCPTLALEPYWT